MPMPPPIQTRDSPSSNFSSLPRHVQDSLRKSGSAPASEYRPYPDLPKFHPLNCAWQSARFQKDRTETDLDADSQATLVDPENQEQWQDMTSAAAAAEEEAGHASASGTDLVGRGEPSDSISSGGRSEGRSAGTEGGRQAGRVVRSAVQSTDPASRQDELETGPGDGASQETRGWSAYANQPWSDKPYGQ